MNTVTVTAKPWYTSKLFWLGIVQAIRGLLEVVTPLLASTNTMTNVHGLVGPVAVSPGVEGFVNILIGVLVMWWRARTQRPIAMSEKPVEVPRAA